MTTQQTPREADQAARDRQRGDRRLVPRLRLPDSTPVLALEGYEFIARQCRRDRSPVFETRLLGTRTTCMLGEDAARVFYDPERFERAGAMPARVQKTLTGQHTVQGLDGEAHRSRKRMHMSLMTPEAVGELAGLTARQWREAVQRWEQAGTVVLYDEVAQLLCRAVCAWAGVPLPESEVPRRTRELLGMINAPVAVGLRHWRGRLDRRRGERWTQGLVEQVRAGTLWPPEGSALHVIAWYRAPDGQLLPARAAAEEVLNVLRPTVAISHFVVYAVLALAAHPHWVGRLRVGGDRTTELFVQEVRRFYPMFPAAAARVRHAFDWNGVHFPRGRRVLLDLYGTNHDPRLWEAPDEFRPERFRHREPGAFELVPQGGGDHHTDHRCAGEWVTIRLLRTAVEALTSWMTYDLPPQDLRLRRSRVPALPGSRCVITNVRQVGE